MTRNYGSLGRRSNSAAWQWVIIGVFLGFACSATLVLGALATGIFTLSGEALPRGGQGAVPTTIVMVVTATPGPETNTPPPTEVLVTEVPTTNAVPPTSAPLVVLAPTTTPTTDPALLAVTPTIAPTLTPTLLPQNVNSAASGSGSQPPAIPNLSPSDLLPVTGGTFLMGTTPQEVGQAVDECVNRDGASCTAAMAQDAFPQHQATVSSFQMERTEVSYQQYLAFLNAMGPGSHRNGCFGQPCLLTSNESDTSNVAFDSANYTVNSVIDNFPVANVTWFGARAYCEAVGRRLPTEAEWERAARGDSDFIYPWSDTWVEANAKTNRPKDAPAGAVAVDSYPEGASPFGMLNVAGNVAEWVSDWYDDRFYGRPESGLPDPTGPASGTQKVVRGGSWDTPPFFARTMHRQSLEPNQAGIWLGFRCAANAANGAAGGNAGSPGALPTGTLDPASLGVNLPGGSSEEQTANGAPTLPAAPTILATLSP